jgi:predicted O-linked N-acetylglucosamine transferase (SPINDLY family)
VTDRLRNLADGWREIATLSDEQLVDLVRTDKIDVLVDLSGHTDLERLAAFAWRPAPVQFSWLGYVATTGMQSIDYIFTDKYFTPDQEAEKFYTEKPVYLPVYRVFRPEAELEIKPLPGLKNGYITFGSFNNFLKLNNNVLELWADLLNQVPNSRFAVIVSAKGAAEYVTNFFGSRGISEDRLMIFNQLSMSHFLQLHWHVDLALDPFPFNGATTSFHGLWMGVPMISMVGPRVVSRSGLSLLAPLGLEEFVVHSPAEYIEKAKYWANNLDRLAEIRDGLRARLKKSPLLDEIEFTRNFEAGFRRCWQEWCATQIAKPSDESVLA